MTGIVKTWLKHLDAAAHHVVGMHPAKVPHPKETIDWYRTVLPPDVYRDVHTKSDAKACLQTLGFLATQCLWLCGCVYYQHISYQPLPFWFCFVMYCVQSNFMINAVHELGHGCVFTHKSWNDVFCRLFALLGWIHPDMFFSSHLRHHRYTQNYPHDQENPPMLHTWKSFLRAAFFNGQSMISTYRSLLKTAAGSFPTGQFAPEWEAILYPDDRLDDRFTPIWWARTMLATHVVIAFIALQHGLWVIPVLQFLAPFLFGGPFWLLNTAQHTGNPYGKFPSDVINDFRRTSRSISCNPLFGFWYWNMNWHCEHHMYAAVPCYNLKRLHDAIAHELPPTLDGVVATWRHIWAQVAIQQAQVSSSKRQS